MQVLGIILLGLFALILLLLLSPISILVHTERGRHSLVVWFLFLRLDVSPHRLNEFFDRSTGKDKHKKKKEPTEKKDKPDKEPFDYRELIRITAKQLKIFCRGLVIDRIKATVWVGTPDACQTALTYGRLASGAAVGLGLLDSLFTLRPGEISILPDFTRGQIDWDIAFRLRLRLAGLTRAGIAAGIAYLTAVRRKNKKQPKQKGGKGYESATSHQ